MNSNDSEARRNKVEIPPSKSVRRYREYLNWCEIEKCRDCGTCKHLFQDMGDPCANCGGEYEETLGRWDEERKVWELKPMELACLPPKSCWEVGTKPDTLSAFVALSFAGLLFWFAVFIKVFI
jgi:hypothetical protein